MGVGVAVASCLEPSLEEGALEFGVGMWVSNSISFGSSTNWWKLCADKFFDRMPRWWWLWACVMEGRPEDLNELEVVDFEDLVAGIHLDSSSVHSLDNSSRLRKLASSRSSSRVSVITGGHLCESLTARGRTPGWSGEVGVRR